MPEGVGIPAGDGRWLVRRFAELDSTNRYVLDAARAGESAGLVVVADHQTAGRGRLDRTWLAPPGSSLLVSVLLRPDGLPAVAHGAVMTAALALVDAVSAVAGFRPDLKWPNDLIAGPAGRKLAGILAERADDAIVIGIGCNVNWHGPDIEALGDELGAHVTACNIEAGRAVARDELLEAFLVALSDRLDHPHDTGRDYRDRLVTLGRRVRVERPEGVLEGDAVDLDDDGALIVRDDDGRAHLVMAADVVHLRG